MNSRTTFNQFVRRSMALVAAVGMAVGLGFTTADAGIRGHLAVTIPFAFNAGRSEMPAGEYMVREISEGVLSFVATDGDHTLVLARADSTGKPGDGVPCLTFACYGTDRYLSEVRAGWDGSVFRVSKTKSEERLAKAGGSPATVLIIKAHGR